MSLDQYITLGRSGLRVSPFCLGAMTFGEDLGWGSSVEESQRIVDRFIELGGDFIDTANFYTKSHSEKIIGDHVGRHSAAWKIAEANVTACFRGWSAFVGLQIEYSLLERSAVQELVPMARELALGITPWSPLKSGMLSGKYTRHNASEIKSDRGFIADTYRTEKTYAIVDELEVVAKAHESTVARVALAWVQAQSGVTSTIIGARRLAQLEDNVKALEVKLSAEEQELMLSPMGGCGSAPAGRPARASRAGTAPGSVSSHCR
jgi:aryl-alcohol dehydrogenase-like predicted oxidoreductase